MTTITTIKKSPLGEELGFPQNQAEMATYQKQYTFDKGTGKWYKPSEQNLGGLATRYGLSAPTGIDKQTAYNAIQAKINQAAEQFKGIQSQVATEGIAPTLTEPVKPTGELPKVPEITPTPAIPPAPTLPSAITEAKKSVWDKIKEFWTPSDKTAEQRASELLPAIPQKVTALDTELANLKTSYEQGKKDVYSKEPMKPMSFVVGEQEELFKDYQIKKQGLLLEREALMGDYKRATERAKTILGFEKEDRDAKREQQKMAIQYLWEEADAEEQRVLDEYNRALDRQEKLDDREYKQKQDEIDDISKIVERTPEAFVGKGWPKSLEEALQTEGGYRLGTPGTIGGGKATFQDSTTGKQYDLGTIIGLKEFKKDYPDYTYEDMNSWLDQNVKGLDATTRKGLLKGAGFISIETKEDKNKAIGSLRATIDDYKNDWKDNGDKGAGTREEFGKRMENIFPELTSKEIMAEIYKEVPNKWLKENKKGNWWNPFD